MGLTGHATIAVIGVAGTGVLWLLGQTEADLPDSVKTLGPMTIGGGLAAWFLRWFITVYIPDLQKQNREQLDKIAASHQTAMTETAKSHESAVTRLVTEFREESKESRAMHTRDMDRIINIYENRPADALRPENVR